MAAAAGIVAAGFVQASQAAEEKGFFGLAVNVDGEGFFLDPTLRSVTISKVTPASPAALNGLAAGDQIVELEGLLIAGRKGRELEPLMKKAVGESLRLRLKRPNGDLYNATLVAVRRPEGV